MRLLRFAGYALALLVVLVIAALAWAYVSPPGAVRAKAY